MSTPVMLAMVGLVGFGISNFFWKVAGERQVYGPSYMLAESLAFCIVGVAIHVIQRHTFNLSLPMTGLGMLGGMLSGVSVFCILLAFRLGGAGSVVFPIARLGVIVSVLLAFLVYREPITATKVIGLGLGMSSIVVLSR